MKILIGCETSGTVRNAFLEQGHDTWSCDILPADDLTNRHIQDDVRKNYDGAINEYKKALKIDSEDWSIWYNLGVSYGRKGEADLAISIYKKVIKLNPESGASYYNRGMQYLTKNEFDKACNDFHAAQRAGIDQACIAIEKYCEPKNLSAEELNVIEVKD